MTLLRAGRRALATDGSPITTRRSQTMTMLDRERDAFFQTYRRLPIQVDRGEGVYLYDTSGRKYLDLFGGLAVNALGYAHPGVIRAIHEQCQRFIHLSNLFVSDAALTLAERLKSLTGFQKVFFTNSGTEAIEGALKIAKLWGASRGRTKIVSFSGAFHGRTYGALSLMDSARYRDGFGPFLENCVVLPYNDPAALTDEVSDTTAALFLEFIQGEGGIVPASREFLATIDALRRRYGFLIVADEIQSGLGRTGRPFAFSHSEVVPDLVAIAKPLGGGLPLGAVLGTDGVGDVLGIGQHGSTFGGNPVACAAAKVVVEKVLSPETMQHVTEVGNALLQGLRNAGQECPSLIKDVRGAGLMIGVELSRPCQPVVGDLLEEGVLVNGTRESVIRIVPPLIISHGDVEAALSVIRRVLLRHELRQANRGGTA